MTLFLDTSICVAALRKSSPEVGERLLLQSVGSIKLPMIVAAELLLGAAKSPRSIEAGHAVEDFLRSFELVPFCWKCAVAYAGLRSVLERKGEVIGPDDMIIAATVLAQGGTLVTHNLREFRRVEGLKTEDWIGQS